MKYEKAKTVLLVLMAAIMLPMSIRADTNRERAPVLSEESESEQVEWEIRFTESGNPGKELRKRLSGKIPEGEELTLNFPEKLIKDGIIWTSTEKSPYTEYIYGPGRAVIRIEYEVSGELPDEEEAEEGEEELESYIEKAKETEAANTGENPEDIPTERFIVEKKAENDIRVLSAASRDKDTDFYVIGKNYEPNGVALSAYFPGEKIYSNIQEAEIEIDADVYYVNRFSVTPVVNVSDCAHDFKRIRKGTEKCLEATSDVYECATCGTRKEVTVLPSGHIDDDGDSICDRCNKRTFEQNKGSVIKTAIAGTDYSFTCIDPDYEGKMLYLCDGVIPTKFFGGYGSADYNDSNIHRYFKYGFKNDFSITGENLIPVKGDDFTGLAYGTSLTEDMYLKYKDDISVSGEFFLRESADGKVKAVNRKGNTELRDISDESCGIRPCIVLEKPDAGSPEKLFWNINDLVTAEVGDEDYIFRCIDQNYSDGLENHRNGALFLCDSVIPANTGSYYSREETENGHEYVFHPGPAVNFGSGNDIKYSNIRKFLATDMYMAETVHTGTDKAYTGSTEALKWEDFDPEDLKSFYIGHQSMTDKMFILSMDEALKYKDRLWRFGDSEENNPETQTGEFSKGYWLSNPFGDSESYRDSGYVYIVDLVNGNIRPEKIKPAPSDNAELNVTGTTGVRPAFVLPQM